MSRRAALICLLLGTVGLALVFLLSTPGNVVRLPGGGEVAFAAVTHGTSNMYPGRGWRNRLARFLPDAVGRRLRSGGAMITTGRTNIVLWFERYGGEMPRVTLRDNHGVEFGQNACGISTGTGAEGGWVEGIGFDVVPRRDKEFFVKLYSTTNHDDPGLLLGEFKLRNPLWAEYPMWTPIPLPATRETNGLAVTLRELSAGVRWSVPMERVGAIHPADTAMRAVFDFAEHGAPTATWTVVAIEASDATGNQFQQGEWMSDMREAGNGRLTLHYRWGLWPSESAWKLRVQVARTANFATDELWTVRGFALNRTDTNESVAVQANLQGAVVRLDGRILENPVLGRKTLQVTVDPPREDYRLDFVRVNDDKGRRVLITGRGSAGRHTFDLKPAADASSLDLTFALHQTYYLEFIAKPELLRVTNVVSTTSSKAYGRELR